jgi:DNA-binding transcriptional LysR family regulator
VASSEYLQANAEITEPDDLKHHDGILIRSPQTGRVRSWQLTGRDPQVCRPLTLKARMTMSDSEAACATAAQGLGIALVSMPFAAGYLETGRLQRVLPDWYIDDGYTSIYYAEHKLLPGKTRAFVDFIIEQFAERGLGQRFSAI